MAVLESQDLVGRVGSVAKNSMGDMGACSGVFIDYIFHKDGKAQTSAEEHQF